MQRRKYLATIGATVGGLALAGCSDSTSGDSASSNGDNSGNGDGDNQPDVEILSHDLYQEQFTSGVRGTAVNNTDSELSYVEANVTFLDSEGTQIGEGLDNVSDLAAGREWEFDCMYTGQDSSRIADYEVEVTTGF